MTKFEKLVWVIATLGIALGIALAIVISGVERNHPAVGFDRQTASNETVEYTENAANLATAPIEIGSRIWVQVLDDPAVSPLPPNCQTENDEGFYVWEDGSIQVAVPNGCVYDQDKKIWRQPIRWR